ncbi:hypothetical protein BaRGS_00021313, partial [Batillaria attramentaria]
NPSTSKFQFCQERLAPIRRAIFYVPLGASDACVVFDKGLIIEVKAHVSFRPDDVNSRARWSVS